MDFVSVTNNKIMKTVLKSDLYKLVEIGEVEVFTPAQLKSYVEMSNDSISKSEGSKNELYKSVVDEMRSFEPVTMWDDKDLQKSVVMVRPAQIAWDNKGDDIEKSLSGRFLDTELNRKFDRVGLHYPMVDPIEKAKKAVLGEIREWSDGKYRKTAKGWEYIKGSDPKSKSGTELAQVKGGGVYHADIPATMTAAELAVKKINEGYQKVEKLPEAVKPIAGNLQHNVTLHDINLAKAKEALKTFSAANGLQDGFNSNSYKKFGSDDVIRSFNIGIKSPNYEDLKAGKVESKFRLSISESQASIPNKYNDKIESVMYDTPNEAFQAGLKFKKKFEEFFNSI